MEPEHECDFGRTDGFGQPLTDDAVCLICGRSIMSGYELEINWEDYEKTPDEAPY